MENHETERWRGFVWLAVGTISMLAFLRGSEDERCVMRTSIQLDIFSPFLMTLKVTMYVGKVKIKVLFSWYVLIWLSSNSVFLTFSYTYMDKMVDCAQNTVSWQLHVCKGGSWCISECGKTLMLVFSWTLSKCKIFETLHDGNLQWALYMCWFWGVWIMKKMK